MRDFSRFFLISGVLLVLLGLGLKAGGRFRWLGRLPGDFSFRNGSFSFYLPLATCLLLSVFLTLALSFFRK